MLIILPVGNNPGYFVTLSRAGEPVLSFWYLMDTVNLEIFVKVLLSGNFAYVEFCENKILPKSLCCLLI